MRAASLLELLQRPFEEDARAPFLNEARVLDERLEGIVVTPPAMAGVARARETASSTLGRPEAAKERAAWTAANALVTSYVVADAALTWERIASIAALVSGSSGLRSGAAFFSGHSAPPAEDLSALLAPLAENVEARTRDVHPIAAAALAQQWIASVHPFEDGNGRTARLVADWVLAQSGLPPATYPSFAAALNTLVDHGRAAASVDAAARVVLRGVEHTITLLEHGGEVTDSQARRP